MSSNKQGSPSHSWQTFKGKSGKKGIPVEELRERLRGIPLNNHTKQRRLAAALGIPQSTLHRNLKALGLKAYSNAIKPFLTGKGKHERPAWSRSSFATGTTPPSCPT